MSEKKDKVIKKVQKDHSSFYDVVNTMDREELKKELSILANYREETEFAKSNDADLKSAKDSVAFLSGPYNDTISVLKLKMSYIHLMLKEQGEDGKEE